MTATNTKRWALLLKDFDEVKAVEDEYSRDVWDPLYEQEQERIKRYGFPDEGTPVGDAHDAWSAESGYDRANVIIEALQEKRLNLRTALMNEPAPDHKALLWKLEIALEPDDPKDADAALNTWSLSFLAQTIADMRRLLGEA